LFDDLGTHESLVAALNPAAATCFLKVLSRKNDGDSLMLQRLLGHTTLMMTNRYCQAVGCYDAVEAHKIHSPIDSLP
jgi:hypothetical protein